MWRRHSAAAVVALALATPLFLASCHVNSKECETVAECRDGHQECEKLECDKPDPEEKGTCVIRPRDQGVDCGTGTSSICDGNGLCVGSCGDGAKNGHETDVDCGGGCSPCDAGSTCGWAGDCESHVCVGDSLPLFCAPPSCDDKLQNGTETDVNCGGMVPGVPGGCAPCGPGKKCALDSDCATSKCIDGICCSVACDGICHVCDAAAGACKLVPAKEDPGDRCPGPDALNACDGAGHCTMCANGQKDASNHETGVDCGGDICDKCPDEQPCQKDEDCLSCNCSEGSSPTCQPSADLCDDDRQDGCETAKNCGGPFCARCGYGDACLQKSDCLSGSCVDKQCKEP